MWRGCAGGMGGMGGAAYYVDEYQVVDEAFER